MELTTQTAGDVVLVFLGVEELDAGNSPHFKSEIAPILEGSTRIVLDLSRVSFIDSSGLGAFLSCLRIVVARGGELKLCGMSKQVRGVFELVRMHRILDTHDTPDAALRAFQGGGAGRPGAWDRG